MSPLRSLTALALAALLASGCLSAPGMQDNHWNVESLSPRIARSLTGYRQDLDGDYREFQWRQKMDINLTIRRHLLNNNPFNPFEADDPGVIAPRPPHSILPDPLMYFHVESITTGLAILAMSNAFVPIPIGSLFATSTKGGADEFARGISDTFSGTWGRRLHEPPSVTEFRVRNPALQR